ncbi:methyltransferase domain-containing protein, partial [Salmonella enterica subsp. enterica serovar Alachua]|nr:methyltransferase domain-containing protein [Salmonella enterica subsp. enterica serovar Alachua]
VEYACKDIHPTTIIDYGCGHGQMTAFLAGLYPCAQVFGIDTSMEQLEHRALIMQHTLLL